MKIVCISDLPPFVTGGAESQAARLVRVWASDNHNVVCLGRRLPDSAIDLGGDVKVPCRRIATIQRFGRLPRALSYFFSLACLLLKEARNADVVYCRFLGDAALTASALKCTGLLRTPLVSTPASSGQGGDIAYIGSIPGRAFWLRMLERHCDRINIIAPALADELLEAGFSGRSFSAIPNGIPLQTLQRPHRTAGPLRIVCVARLVAQKGVDVLLRALGLLPGHAQWQLELVGDGPDMESLKALAGDLGIGDRIRWRGMLDAGAVRDALLESDLFVLPSRYEGMSNSALEAMEAGLAMVVTRCGGIDRYVDDSIGWVVAPDDASALTEGLLAALNCGPRQLSEMGMLARKLAADRFSIEVTARQHLEMFGSLAH